MRIFLIFRTFLPIAAFIFLANCGTETASRDPYGVWKGHLVTDQGRCPTENLSLLQIRNKEIVFTPGNGSKVLHGKLNTHLKAPHYHAELTDKGMNNTVYRMVFDGYPVNQNIGGLYASPQCHAHITLTRRDTSLF